MSLWEAKNYRESFEIDGINVLFKDAGHILGSAMIEITNSESEEGKAKKRSWFLPATWAILPNRLSTPRKL